MKHKERFYKTTSGRQMLVIDDYFSISQIRHFKNFAEKSNYTLGTVTSSMFEHSNKNETFYKCSFTIEDNENFGLYNLIKTDFAKYFKNKHIPSAWISATFSGNRIRYHCDSDKKDMNNEYSKLEDCKYLTLLFYCNLKWDMEDGGETIFCEDNGEPEIAIGCKPNRMIIFDSHIPHRPSMTRTSVNEPRFCYVLPLNINE